MSVSAQIIGEHAQALLQAGRTVRVLARTSQAIFLSVQGELVWVSPNPVLHRRAILVERLPLWPEDLVLAVQGQSLVHGQYEPLHFHAAVGWTPPALSRSPQDLPGRAARFGLLFLPFLLQVQECLGASKVQRVQEAVRAQDGPSLTKAARDLVGYGPGLTPLGDDFLGGVLFGLWAAHRHLIGAADLMAWAQGRTSWLSLCLLSDLGQGHGPAPLHAFASALFAGSWAEAKREAFQLLGIGNTTGMGLLCGTLCTWALC